MGGQGVGCLGQGKTICKVKGRLGGMQSRGVSDVLRMASPLPRSGKSFWVVQQGKAMVRFVFGETANDQVEVGLERCDAEM